MFDKLRQELGYWFLKKGFLKIKKAYDILKIRPMKISEKQVWACEFVINGS